MNYTITNFVAEDNSLQINLKDFFGVYSIFSYHQKTGRWAHGTVAQTLNIRYNLRPDQVDLLEALIKEHKVLSLIWDYYSIP